ncbi:MULTISPECIES: 4-hydroxy-tetrahydrodipicolinate synthase [Legionella]|uniref:4-hydroxy-tetrahydrodipicolinate synthase n=1 Tax=Legionella maceachernii TaxID=466 RepID=A0A0W0WG22_9GAMM|nr:4-hydroxy-tetrahydrodipicolinate synthase [Legionella maceachernii]KTD31297.1 dihydrodipicolinate synthase [Legionella maceachernii]SKA00241.1 4-hydroxy-tetrahydrodipicolinate synthase [Legionella maceachernii]SUP01321.1 Dihydrodipicolinate synthase [Legionella maceachernii]
MFRGSIVALVTPMQDGQVDEPRLRELVEFHIAAGTHAIVPAGTTGEAGTLSHHEKLFVIKTVVEQVRERLPVIAGTAMNSTKDCIELTREAMECGAHAALIMTPAYIKPTQEGLYQHYSAIAHAVAMPIILYNVPSRTACDMLPETVARLAKISNIVGIKEATGQMARLQQILRTSQESMDVYSGDDLTAAQWLLAGAKGVISVTANVAPRQMAKLCDAALDDDHAGCLRINEQLMKLHELLFVESNPIPVKWALSKMGLIRDELRLPLTSLSKEHHQALEQVLRTLQLV